MRQSVSLNELVEGVSVTEQGESSDQGIVSKINSAVGDGVLGDGVLGDGVLGDGVLGDTLDDGLVAKQLADSSGLDSIDDPDSGSMGSLPT